MSRGGRDKAREDGPERRCIATGDSAPAQGLIRFVIGPDATVVPDLAGKLPGRGIWVTSQTAALEKAVQKRLFSRAARAQVIVPDDLPGLVEAGLTRRVIDLISLARKAGYAVAGYEKVKGWLLTGEATVLVQASDGSERGKSKLKPPVLHNGQTGKFLGMLSAQELGLAFGREHVIHAALAAGGLTRRVVEDAARLKGLREMDGENAPERTKGSHER
ncbi:MAG: RNA-binding protein [Celeribacter sp.]